ncbi:MAG: hypothetical protein Q8867_01560 [Bacteroidota bacterium]|nr:hypothetical protein [Bacteroidota bacterium]
MAQRKDILIIGIIYRTYDETLRYADSLSKFPDKPFHLLLVDNSEEIAPADFTTALNKYDFLEYYKSSGNHGYMAGAEEGLEKFKKENPYFPEWVLVTNVDIVFDDFHFFEILKSYTGRSAVGMVAPSIISSKWGTDYNPEKMHRYSLARLRFYQVLYSCFLFNNVYTLLSYAKRGLIKAFQGKERVKDLETIVEKKIYAPHGSCMIFHKDYFDRGGTFRHFSFLFGEEIFVAETTLKLGLDVVYNQSMRVLDYEHASIGWFVSPKLNRYHRTSNREIIRNFFLPDK